MRRPVTRALTAGILLTAASLAPNAPAQAYHDPCKPPLVSNGGGLCLRPPAGLKCTPPQRPRQVWFARKVDVPEHLVWRCVLVCDRGSIPRAVRNKAGKPTEKCVRI
ncbi:MAG: hypothetical protein ACHP84_19495 [Caulobacterales bacterium]